MNCPKCKMENPAGASYCEFCYERFQGHSAANTYIQAMQRARAMENKNVFPSDQKAAAPSAPSIDFSAKGKQAVRAISEFFARFWRPLSVLAAGFLLLFFIEESLNPVIRFHYFGARLTYAFPAQTTLTYVFGSTTNVARWSERGRNMDTPLGDLKIADVATVNVLGTPEKKHKTTPVTLSSTNWLLEIYRKKGLESHLLNQFAPAHFWMDAHGVVIRREQGTSIRIAKSLAFLALTFPARRLHETTNWSDTAQWTDALDGWTVDWSAQRRWQVDSASTCGDDFCLQLRYDALLTPHVVDEPAWMSGAIWPRVVVHGTGTVVFNVTRHALVSHHLEYAETLRGAISDVGRIPKNMRVGRRAFHAPGEIVFDLKNSSSLQRN